MVWNRWKAAKANRLIDPNIAVQDGRGVHYVNYRKRPFYYAVLTNLSHRVQMVQSRGNSGLKIGDGYIVLAFEFYSLRTNCGGLAEDAGYKLHEFYRKDFQVKHLTYARRIIDSDEFTDFLDELDSNGGFTDESYKAFKRHRS